MPDGTIVAGFDTGGVGGDDDRCGGGDGRTVRIEGFDHNPPSFLEFVSPGTVARSLASEPRFLRQVARVDAEYRIGFQYDAADPKVGYPLTVRDGSVAKAFYWNDRACTPSADYGRGVVILAPPSP